MQDHSSSMLPSMLSHMDPQADVLSERQMLCHVHAHGAFNARLPQKVLYSSDSTLPGAAHQHRSGSPLAVRSGSFRHRFHLTDDIRTRGDMLGCPTKFARMLTAILVVFVSTPQSDWHPKRPNAGNSHGYSHCPAIIQTLSELCWGPLNM